MSELSGPDARQGRVPLVVRASGVVAVLGGLISLATAVVVVLSVAGRWFRGSAFASLAPGIGPIDGDFEYVKMGTAIAVFAFLPYAQAMRSNIVVDTFTNKLSTRTVDRIDAFWDLVYAAMMGVLTGCMVLGTRDFLKSGETTMMLQFVVWPAIAVCTLLSGVLTLVAVVTAVRLARGQA
ncbi:MAG: TRAP transporter small permease subunit [Hyphomicrobiaceae bacterium]|nr:TRAP transporter small permease subunit [Hyphomicrobiaceae bacterium]